MADLGKTKKMCANGHVMDPAWDVCPYCPSERQRGPELARTVRMEDAGKPAGASAAASARKTEVLQRGTSSTAGAVGWLVGLEKPHRGKMHRIDGERVTLGAAPGCDVVIDDPHVSDRQASVRYKDKTFVITDLDSTNGTFVNGEKIGQQTLTDGDRVRLGSCEWMFKCVIFDT
jgi:hypothetical protein